MSRPLGKSILVVAGMAMAATIGAAIWVMGGPGAQRERRLDERRIGDLRDLQSSIEQYHRDHDRVPPDLATLAGQPGVALPLSDPITGQTYVYVVEAADRYRLCATFATDTARDGQRGYGFDTDWAHGTGNTCFQRRIKAE